MTKIVNLDALATAPKLTILVDGVKHDMVEPTVQSFIDNMTEIEAMGMNPSPLNEMKLGVKIIQRAFPTISEEAMSKWTLERLNMLVNIARSGGAEIVTDDAEEAASGNAPKAD